MCFLITTNRNKGLTAAQSRTMLGFYIGKARNRLFALFLFYCRCSPLTNSSSLLNTIFFKTMQNSTLHTKSYKRIFSKAFISRFYRVFLLRTLQLFLNKNIGFNVLIYFDSIILPPRARLQRSIRWTQCSTTRPHTFRAEYCTNKLLNSNNVLALSDHSYLLRLQSHMSLINDPSLFPLDIKCTLHY